jgi:hypothetical protein
VVSAERVIGEYRIIDRIGKGGMATVYKAVHPNRAWPVAIKILFPVLAEDESFKARFKRELHVLLRLKHPHIVPVLDFGHYQETAYIVMPYMECGTLEDRLKRGSLTPREGARLMGQVASALEYAHQAGIIHRDVKPSNILLQPDGSALLTDFGLAHLVDASMSLTGSAVIGTPAYMSPEQCKGERVDARSDQYSLAVILYQLCTGQLPYQGDTPLAVVIQHVNEPLPRPRQVNPNLPVEVEDVLLKALSKDPKGRYATVEGFNAGFQKALSQALKGGKALIPRLRRGVRQLRSAVMRPSKGAGRKDHRPSRIWLAVLTALVLLACPITSMDPTRLAVGAAGARQSENRSEIGAAGEGSAAALRANESPVGGNGEPIGYRRGLIPGVGSPSESGGGRPTTTVQAWEATASLTSAPASHEGPAEGTAPVPTKTVPDPVAPTQSATMTIENIIATSPISTPTPLPTATPTVTGTAAVEPTASPSSTHTPTSTPTLPPSASPTTVPAGCSVGDVGAHQFWAGWELINNGNLRIRVERITIKFPWHNEAIKRIGLDDDLPIENIIWEGREFPPSATINSDWASGSELDIPAGQSRLLVFEFADQAASAGYALEVTFHNNCVIRTED